ncbi:CoA ester lyase [Acidisphaera sp. L21]|uniref:HpcH/HpaI aldolase/citrate lyase family protein n=1 Tax=Acidisphaera sp. L21 TaxID=1641851 RepID=UPI00131C187E|nr:aldolase/citrate lyase family protein [Acidisphaera sp. L21]
MAKAAHKIDFQPVLSGAGHKLAVLDAMEASAARRIFIDLEALVPDDQKDAGLEGTIEALKTRVWAGKSVCVRVNGFHTDATFHEIHRLITHGGPRLDAILFPMANTADDIVAIDRFVDQTARRAGAPKPPAIEILIETPRALTEIVGIARASKLTTALHFGAGDFTRGMGMTNFPSGSPHKEYGMWSEGSAGSGPMFHPADIWQHALSVVAVTARAYDLLSFDGPFVEFTDMDAYAQQCRRARALGLCGKWAANELHVTTQLAI